MTAEMSRSRSGRSRSTGRGALDGAVDYPDSYTSPVRFIKRQRGYKPDGRATPDSEWFCYTCSFRPWADSGKIRYANVTVTRASGATETVSASLGADGRWRAAAALGPGDSAVVGAGGIGDENGEYNGASSGTVTG
jgi:hypothetical protein